jgi:hypothetical protein
MIQLSFWNEHTPQEIATEIRNCATSIVETNDSCNIEIWFAETIFDRHVASALMELFRLIAEKRVETRGCGIYHRKLIVSRLQLDRCQGNQYLNDSIEAALTFDVVEAFCVDGRIGTYELLNTMRCTRRPIHLRELDLRYFKISVRELGILRSWILDPSLRKLGGGLERLSFCNVSFVNDQAVRGLAEALSLLSTREEQSPDENENGRFLQVLWLYYCDLKDLHLEHIVRSLMQVEQPTNEVIIRSIPKETFGIPEDDLTINTAPTVYHSTLKSLTIEQKQCGPKLYSLMGAWLLNLDCVSPIDSASQRSYRCPCSLETVNITVWSAIKDFNFTDPVEFLTQDLPWKRESDDRDVSKDESYGYYQLDDSYSTRFSSSSSSNITDWHDNDSKTNTTLRTLRLSGVENMDSLGRLVSEHLLGLESLHVHSRGATDDGVTEAKLSSFVAASGGLPYSNHERNESLRKLDFHCREKTTRAELESSPQLLQLLRRYPMLQDVRFGFRRKASSNDTIQQMMNANAAGRFLFVPSRSGPQLPIALWPRVLEGFHQKMLLKSESYDDIVLGWVETGSDEDDDENMSPNGDGEDVDSYSEGETNDESAKPVPSSTLAPPRSKSESEFIQHSATAMYSILKLNIDRLAQLRRLHRKRAAEDHREDYGRQEKHRRFVR